MVISVGIFGGSCKRVSSCAKDINLKRKIILKPPQLARSRQLPQAYTALWPRTITSARHRIVAFYDFAVCNVAASNKAALTKAQFCFKESIELFNNS
jgi:hypothetical protein